MDSILDAIPGSPQTKATLAAGAVAVYFVALFVRGLVKADSILGKICTFIVDGLKPKSAASSPAAAASAPSDSKPPAAPAALALLVAGSLLAASSARADGTSATPALQFGCLDQAQQFCLRPVAGFSGTGYDFTQHEVLRSVTVNGLLELTLLKDNKLGLLAGPGFQTGTVQAFAVSGGFSLPFNASILASGALVGNKASFALSAGYVLRI